MPVALSGGALEGFFLVLERLIRSSTFSCAVKSLEFYLMKKKHAMRVVGFVLFGGCLLQAAGCVALVPLAFSLGESALISAVLGGLLGP